MFAHDRDAPLVEDPNLTRMKIKCKIRDNYSKLGEVPGVLVDKVARQKLLKDLGHATTTSTAKQEQAGEEEAAEETKTEVSMVT